MKVRNELNNNHNSDPNGIILRLHTWGSDIDNERQIVSDYKDYQIIDDFYIVVRSRNCYLLQNQVSSEILSILNKDCVNKAKIVCTEIDWRKFHKLDLLLLIPAIILGSLFITTVSPPFIFYPHGGPPIFTLLVFPCIILRGIVSFFIIRLTLKATQGVIVNNYGLPTIFRSYALLFFCFVIVGIVPIIARSVINTSETIHYDVSVLIADFTSDIGSMFLLTWVVWWWYIKNKVKSRRHLLFKKE